MDNQPPRETQAHLNQRSHQGAIPDQPVPEQYGPARIVTLLKSIDGCGHICSETAHELAHWLAACESARAKLAEENAEMRKDGERLDKLAAFLTIRSDHSIFSPEENESENWELGTTENYSYEVLGAGKTVRAAIDALAGGKE